MTHICEAHIAYVYNEWNVFIFNIPYHAGCATEMRNSCGLNLISKSDERIKNVLLEFRSDVLEKRSGSIEHVSELSGGSGRGWSCCKLVLYQLTYPRRHHEARTAVAGLSTVSPPHAPHHAQAPPGQRRPTVTQCSDWLSAADGSLVSKL